MSLNIGEALGYSVLGFAIVFVVIIALWMIVAVLVKAVNAGTGKVETANEGVSAASVVSAEPAAASAQKRADEIILKNVSERDAALIMAIVANKMKKPLNELRFKSIAEVNDDEI